MFVLSVIYDYVNRLRPVFFRINNKNDMNNRVLETNRFNGNHDR